MKRSEARERTFIILFQYDFDEDFLTHVDDYLTREGLTGATAHYAKNTLLGVADNIDYIDDIIRKYLVNWHFDRLNKTDTAVLRLAIYEIFFNDEIPDKVAINEAIELAKKYNDEKAGIFVNGLLDRAYKNEKLTDR